MSKVIVMSALAFVTGPGHHRNCGKLFTVQMGEHAGRSIYSSATRATLPQLRTLGYIERCQRNPQMQSFVRNYDRRLDREWKAAHLASYAEVASWYNDAGTTASGWHSYYGVANKTLPFGTAVTFRYQGRAVTAVVDDRGPFVGGRDWDLNQNTAGALGFGGVDVVMSSVYGG